METGRHTVTSADGTPIAYRCAGSGPAVVLVGGGLDDGSENAPLMPVLAGEFTVYNYARRGRADSGDTRPYTVRREVEDLAALLDEAGGSAHVFGASSGGALALEAAAAGLPVNRLVVYDVPYNVGVDAVARWRAYRAELAYDAAVLGDDGPPADRLARIGQDTMVLTRSSSDPYMPALPVEFFDAAADAVATALPHATRHTIDAPGHAVDAAAVAPPVRAFLAGST